MNQIGLFNVSNELIKDTIGLELKDAFSHFLDDSNLISQCEVLFKEKADEVMTPNTVLFPETYSVIKILKSKGFQGKSLWLDVAIWVNDEPDQYDNHVSISNGKGSEKVYVGQAKKYQKKGEDAPF